MAIVVSRERKSEIEVILLLSFASKHGANNAPVLFNAEEKVRSGCALAYG